MRSVLALVVTVFVTCTVVNGCATPKVTAAPSEHTCPAEAEAEYLYCGCIAMCGDGPPGLIGMPEESCRNPPPGCRALPVYCEADVVAEFDSAPERAKTPPVQQPEDEPDTKTYFL